MNKRNYQLEMDMFLSRLQDAGVRPGLLLHCCCAPCSSYVFEYLAKYFRITAFFCNPNMDSEKEYKKRADELIRLAEMMYSDGKLPEKPDVITAEYDPESFEIMTEGLEASPERGERCGRCYELRLRRTAELLKQSIERESQINALKAGFDSVKENIKYKKAASNFSLVPVYFATTLTLSPKKNAVMVNEAGERIAGELGLYYLPSDFKCRGGYERSFELSEKYGLYRQDYCGCRFSRR